MFYRFAEFRYDPLGRRLFRGTKEIALRPKAKALLCLLLENEGRLLTHQEILDRAWPEVAVTDDAVRFQIAELRRALGDRRGRLLKTIPREGYRFDVSIEREELRDRLTRNRPAAASRPEFICRLILETREVVLFEGENLIGRAPDAVLWIDHTSVSRRHARIVIEDRIATLEDLGSRNGTYLREDRVERPCLLQSGDEIRVGPVRMIFRVLTRTESTESAGRGGTHEES
jgi:DNA-binding winged helix-turn-helix (wHTH) protein